MERIHTGIVDVLHGHDAAIHIAAYKRGHLILDKAMVAHCEPGEAKEDDDEARMLQQDEIGRAHV